MNIPGFPRSSLRRTILSSSTHSVSLSSIRSLGGHVDLFFRYWCTPVHALCWWMFRHLRHNDKRNRDKDSARLMPFFFFLLRKIIYVYTRTYYIMYVVTGGVLSRLPTVQLLKFWTAFNNSIPFLNHWFSRLRRFSLSICICNGKLLYSV